MNHTGTLKSYNRIETDKYDENVQQTKTFQVKGKCSVLKDKITKGGIEEHLTIGQREVNN